MNYIIRKQGLQSFLRCYLVIFTIINTLSAIVKCSIFLFVVSIFVIPWWHHVSAILEEGGFAAESY